MTLDILSETPDIPLLVSPQEGSSPGVTEPQCWSWFPASLAARLSSIFSSVSVETKPRLDLGRSPIHSLAACRVSRLKVEADDKYERIGGTSMGGGTFWGLGSLLTKAKGFDELLQLASAGDHRNVDLLVKDIYVQLKVI
ncbi:Pantothenate kinase 4 [Chionoecetes opilio]|uniref:Pantothenate kinase 4 n=1 Tax=Chionoecetes opilio TaxID=41210 RepID=A0A8J4XY10_CHIOP|nr:Pantothenate kinase 4 [Chionoecetes opilio]